MGANPRDGRGRASGMLATGVRSLSSAGSKGAVAGRGAGCCQTGNEGDVLATTGAAETGAAATEAAEVVAAEVVAAEIDGGFTGSADFCGLTMALMRYPKPTPITAKIATPCTMTR